MTHTPGPLEALADGLSVDEQARLAGGDDDWHTAALPAHGVPRVKLCDGPVGVRGESYVGPTSASFPCGSLLGASFDRELLGRIGGGLAAEARTKATHVVLGPTINLHRHPLGGRNFESYGEDPVLVAALGVAYVTGMQERGVAACAKHFAANDVELERLSVSVEVDERTLREVYLRPFEAAVRDAGVWTVMGSYNRLHGTYACEHPWLLSQVLKGEWGFDGVVVSDWHAAHATERNALAGLDLEMPGPAKVYGAPLAEAVRAGRVPAAQVADAARRVLRLADRVGATAEEPAEQGVDSPEIWALAREAAAAGMVLLRNEPVDGVPLLPLAGPLGRVAVIGPNAETVVTQGGGSAQVSPHRIVGPVDGLRNRLGDGVEVVLEPGTARGHILPPLDDRLLRTPDGRPGIRFEYRPPMEGRVPAGPLPPAPEGEPLDVTVNRRVNPVWSGRFSPLVDQFAFSVTGRAVLTARRSGTHAFSLTGVGPTAVWLDGELLIDNRDPQPSSSFFGAGSKTRRAERELVAGEDHELVVVCGRTADDQIGGVRLGVQEPLGDDPIAAAAAAAAAADVAVVVVGNDEDIEREGVDRRSLGLQGEQDVLVRAVLAAQPRTVVVLVSGSAVSMPWLAEAPAVLWTGFPGMAGGEALAAVLLGDDEPGGRLPFTVPSSLDDVGFSIERTEPPGHLHLTEGLDVGHRSYLRRGVEPLAWFGAGRGYTTFAWGEPSGPDEIDRAVLLTRAASGTVAGPTVHVPVTNTGSRRGSEVVLVFARRPASVLPRPDWVLAGFAKVTVEPGATEEVAVVLDPAAFRHWDDDRGRWDVEAGPVELRFARTPADPGIVGEIDIV